MARTTKKPEIDFSGECMDAFDRVVALAHRTASLLSGDPLSAEGKAETPRSAALVSAMLYFLLRTDPSDLEALFFADGSLNQVPFTSGLPATMRNPPLAALVG